MVFLILGIKMGIFGYCWINFMEEVHERERKIIEIESLGKINYSKGIIKEESAVQPLKASDSSDVA